MPGPTRTPSGNSQIKARENETPTNATSSAKPTCPGGFLMGPDAGDRGEQRPVRANADAQRPTSGACAEDQPPGEAEPETQGGFLGLMRKPRGRPGRKHPVSLLSPSAGWGVAVESDRGLWGADTRVLEHTSTSSPHSGISSRISYLVAVADSDALLPIWK